MFGHQLCCCHCPYSWVLVGHGCSGIPPHQAAVMHALSAFWGWSKLPIGTYCDTWSRLVCCGCGFHSCLLTPWSYAHHNPSGHNRGACHHNHGRSGMMPLTWQYYSGCGQLCLHRVILSSCLTGEDHVSYVDLALTQHIPVDKDWVLVWHKLPNVRVIDYMEPQQYLNFVTTELIWIVSSLWQQANEMHSFK